MVIENIDVRMIYMDRLIVQTVPHHYSNYSQKKINAEPLDARETEN